MKKKWSRKKKVIAAIIIIAVLSLLAAVLYIAFKPEDPITTQIAEIEKGDITETFDTTAIVQSANQDVFEIFDGIKVETVNVRVGDNVKKGDVLATFDTSSLNSLLSEKRDAYNTAQKAYNDYISGAKNASAQLDEISAQVATLNKEIADLEKKVTAEKAEAEKKKEEVTEPVTQPQKESETKPEEQINEDDLKELREALKEVLGNNKMSDKIIDRLLSQDSATAQLVDALQELVGLTNVQMPSFEMPTIDMSAIESMTSSMISENEKLLIEKEIQLVQLKVQEGVFKTQSTDSLKSVYKTIADSAKDSYTALSSQVALFNTGWVAADDGFVREVNIKEGETVASASNKSGQQLDITSILATVTSGNYDVSKIISAFTGQSKNGIVLEYYPLEATFEVSKYDISKIHMDQKVTVTSADGKEYNATVNYISAVADSSGSGLNINALMGSGGATSNTLTAKVEIEKADRSVIIGMDVELSAALETKKDVTLVPVEAIQYDNESGYYVFKYNEKEKIIEKTSIVVGLFDGVNYEVVEGLEVSDKIVRAPLITMKDGQSVVPA